MVPLNNKFTLRFIQSLVGAVLLFFTTSFIAKNSDETIDNQAQVTDSVFIRQIFDQALVHGEAYRNLEYLCLSIGHRLSGSVAAEKAVGWTESVMQRMNLDRVYRQPIEVPFWVRGDKEWAVIRDAPDYMLSIKTLGGSVSSNGILEAEVIEVQSLNEVATMDAERVKGKIIFYNRPMDPRLISTFEAYGGCVDQRYGGAMEAAKMGAIAVIVRSMTNLENDPYAHTGSMGYSDEIKKIPAIAVCTRDANYLHNRMLKNKSIKVAINVNPSFNKDASSSNVIGEIRGSVHPEKIIVIGGHLDSWDVGHGAHDDGAGIVHSMEVLRILKSMNYKPNYTIRAVMFMNEENGNMGGKGYAKKAFELKENHIAAIESDRGGFSPRGFSIKGNDEHVRFIQSFKALLEPYGLHYFEKGYGGVDIGPLIDTAHVVNKNIMLMGLVPDSQRYFDYHHSEDDVFENVNKRELELGCASMAAMVYLLDQYLQDTQMSKK